MATTVTAPLLTPTQTLTNHFALLSTYRHLLRATRLAFSGDSTTLTAARRYAREAFSSPQSRALVPGSVQAAQGVKHAQDVTRILREHVVQGRRVEGSGGDVWRLGIRKETQRLDNETIRQGGLRGTGKSFEEVKGGGF